MIWLDHWPPANSGRQPATIIHWLFTPKGILIHHNKYVVNLHDISTLLLPSCRRFGGVLVEEFAKTWVYHWVVGQFLANSKRIPVLNKMWYAWNMSNTFGILTMGRMNVEVLRKICFIKNMHF